MHTVDLLDAAIRFARGLGIQVREDWLDGASSGECEICGERWLFLDLSQSPQERLEVVAQCLLSQARLAESTWPQELRPLFQLPSAA
jgi:hypothetical protein